MKKTMYYVMPFIIIPVYIVSIHLLYINDFIEPSGFVLFWQHFFAYFIPILIGNLTPTHRKFDYIMTAMIPLSCFFAMFMWGLLNTGYICSGTPKFSLDTAFNCAFHPDTLQWCFIAGVITFLSSFKPIRIVGIIKRKKNF